MKTLLCIAPHLSTGGLPQYLVKKIELLKDVYNIYVIEYDDVTGGVLVVQRNRIKNLIGDRLITLSSDKRVLLDIINSIKPDFIHFEEIPEYFCDRIVASAIYKTDRAYKIFETCHDSSVDVSIKMFKPDTFVLVSNYQVDMLSPLGVPSIVVDYPIEFVNRIRKNEYMNDLGLDLTKKHVLNVGLFTPRKNQQEFFEYASKMPDIQFHCVGNMADNFKFYWEPLLNNKPTNVTIWGERSDVHKFYQAMDLLLFTSRGTNTDKETMPLVLKEAIANGIPICLYNLPVYKNFFNSFNDITYLSFLSKNDNVNKIRKSLGLIDTYSSNHIFHTTDGIVDFGTLYYPNSMWETYRMYGVDATVFWGQYIHTELQSNGVGIEHGDVYVDLGANNGMSCRRALELGASKVIAFEPDPNMVSILKQNCPFATVYPLGVSTHVHNVELYHWPYNDKWVGPKYIAKMVTLTDALNLVDGDIDYLKVDIEGSERDVFNMVTIDDMRRIKKMFIEYHFNDTIETFVDTICNLGFNVDYEVGTGQSYLYCTNVSNQTKYKEMDTNTAIVSLDTFNVDWDWESQRVHYSVNHDVNIPITICIKEYKSDAVTWSTQHDSLYAGWSYWLSPIPKDVHNYYTSDTISGVKICIYNTHTGEQLYEKPYFNKFINLPTVSLSNTVPYYINYVEFFVHDKYKNYLNSTYNTVVDVGANVGVFTSYMLHKKLAKQIVCIECDTRAIEDLNNNFYTNPAVTIIPKALHYNNYSIDFYESVNPVVSSTISDKDMEHHNMGVLEMKKTSVQTITLRDIINTYGVIDLLKIDIEGAEYDIIEYLDDLLLNHVNNLIIECHFFQKDYLSKYHSLLDKIRRNGFSVVEYENNQAITYVGGSEVIFAHRLL